MNCVNEWNEWISTHGLRFAGTDRALFALGRCRGHESVFIDIR